jgi:hypothetical protein
LLNAKEPTAVHALLDGHDTARNSVNAGPGGWGSGTIDQLTPSHCSTSALLLSVLSIE